jgi:enediyne biosynthesis protein E7
MPQQAACRRKQMLDEAPGPRGWPLFGVALQFRQDPLRLVMEATAKYGNVVQLPLLRLPMTPLEPRHRVYIVNDAVLARQICLTNRHKYRTHSQLVDKLKSVLQLDDGELLTSTGEEWAQRKASLQPAFNACADWAGPIIRSVNAMADKWSALPEGTEVDLDREMTTLVTHLFARLFAGLDLDGADTALAADWDAMLNGFSRRMAIPFPFLLRFPTRANRSFQRAAKNVERRLTGAVRDHRQCPHGFADILSAWLRASHARDGRLTDKSVRDQLVLLLLAGRKNVSNALTWAFHLLGEHPDIARAAAAEIGDAGCGRELNPEAWKRLTYIAAIQKEVLRLYPTAWLIARQSLEEDAVGGYRIPAGATIFISPYVIHRRRDLWPDPELFAPERFLPESRRGTAPDAYLPFGIGARTCIGNTLTELMMRVAIATLISRFEFRSLPGHKAQIRATSSLYPRDGMPMLISRRQTAVHHVLASAQTVGTRGGTE